MAITESDCSRKRIQKIREDSKEMTRLAIIEAAERVLFRDGWISGTMENIAHEAGLTKGGILYYFRSKNDLLVAALKAHSDRRNAFMDKRLAEMEKDGDAPAGGKALLAWLDFVLTDKYYGKIIVFLTANPLLRSKMLEIRRKMVEEWCMSCSDQVEAVMIFSMIESMILDCFHDGSAYPKDLLDQYVAKMRERIKALK